MRFHDNFLYQTSNHDRGLIRALVSLQETNRELTETNQRLERKVTELSFLYEVASKLMNSYELHSLLESMLLMALKITGSEAGCILLAENTYSCPFTVKVVAGDISPEVQAYLTGQCKCLTHMVVRPEIKAYRSGDKSFNPLQQIDPYLRSMMAVPLQIEKKVIGLILVMHRHSGTDEHRIDYSEDDRRTLSIFAQQAALVLENTSLKIEYARKDIYLKTISALTSTIDAKDVYTRNHSRRVAGFSVALAKELHLNEEEVVNIRYGAILHDIGKIGIAENILNKKGKLSQEEFQLIKAHPVIGIKILEPIDFLTEALNIVCYHHERYDGMGYPEGLKGEGIPYSARIVGIADAWDAMTSRRSYRRALSYEKAVEELRNGSGTQFDPYMVKKFLKMVGTSGKER